MRLIENELPPGLALGMDEKAVVKRIVHACGDPAVAGLVRFSHSAVDSGLRAIAGKRPIFTDVRMVAVGISRQLAVRVGCPVHCALDSLDGASPGDGATRAATAIRLLGKKLDGSIVAVGNAPTALLALLELIDSRLATPALVVGMPVGFVNAAESKQELVKRAVPSVTVEGTRGGSAMAVAAVNALLRIATARQPGGSAAP